MRRIGIRFRLAVAFLGFSAIVIALLWILQVVFLNDVYKAIKTDSVRRSAARMNGMSDEEMASFAEEISASYGICTTVYDGEMNEVVRVHAGGPCLVHSLRPASAAVLYEAVEEDRSGYMESYLSAEEIQKILERLDASRGIFRFFEEYGSRRYGPSGSADPYDCFLRCQTVTGEDGSVRFISMSAVIVPVDATVLTIRFEMIIISIFLILVSIILSFVLSRRIAKPLVQLNTASKELPKGRFDPEGIRGDREIMELSETLATASEEINKVETLRRELIANVSHDLRTPLTLITGYSEVMRDLPGENTPENLQIVIDETRRLSDLVTDLLDLSKMEAGMDQLKLERLDLVDLVRGIMHRYEKLTENDGIILTFRTDAESCFVKADAVKLNQALYNLINNAVNYCGADKTVIVSLSVREGIARLDVIDHGEGISREKLKDIWDRYYRVDKTHTQARVGTGLGLSIVKEVLLLHQANYGVESEPGKGSDFWFEIPLSPEN